MNKNSYSKYYMNLDKEQYYVKYDNPVENAYNEKIIYSSFSNFFRKCFCCILDEK